MTSTTLEQEATYDFSINAILDLTIGRYNIASIDPRNIAPFMQQCKRDISEILDAFAQRQIASASRQASRPTSALENNNNNNDQQTMYKYLLDKQNQNNNDGNNNNNNKTGPTGTTTIKTEKEEELYKALLASQTNEASWKDMCSELVDELESAQAKRNEVTGQLDRRENLLKEMRIAYFTEITHLREMVRQFKTKGSCALPEISTFNWKDDSILSEQLIREQKQKHAQSLEEERLRHQRELDLAYERYSKANEHLRAQITQLEREKRGRDKNKVSSVAQTAISGDLTNNNQQLGSMTGGFATLGSMLPGSGGVDLNNDKRGVNDNDSVSSTSSSIASNNKGGKNEHEENDDEASMMNNSHELSRRDPSSSSLVKFEDSQIQQNGQHLSPQFLRPDSASPSNVPLSRMASNFDKQSNLSVTGYEQSYPPTPVPQPPTPKNNNDNNFISGTNVSSSQQQQQQQPPPQRIDSPLKTSPTTTMMKTTTTKTKTTKKTKTTTNPSSARPSSARTAKKTAARPSSASSQSPQNSKTSTPRGNNTNKKATSSTTAKSFDFFNRMSSNTNNNQQQQVGGEISGVSERTLTQLMDNHKRALDTMRAERDSAITRSKAVKEQLSLSLKKIDKFAADAQDREEEITDLRKRLENPSGDSNNPDGSGGNSKNAVEIKATNLRLREELLRKNHILEVRTKELLQLQEETGRWFEAFRAIHPADRSPINYAVLERLAIAVQKAEQAEATYRQSTWTLLSAQLRHRSILDKMKEEAKQLHQQQTSTSTSTNSSSSSSATVIAQARKLQKQTELVFSQLWRQSARLRQARTRSKNEANIAWDTVLFTARALVNHEDISVVHEFCSLINEPTLKKKDEHKYLEDRRAEVEAENKRKEEEHEKAKRDAHDEKKHGKNNNNNSNRPRSSSSSNHNQQQQRSSAIIKGTSFLEEDQQHDGTRGKNTATRKSTSPPMVLGVQGVADVEEQHELLHRPMSSSSNNVVNSSRSRALMKKPSRPGSAASTIVRTRPQTPISAMNDLRCLPLSQIPTSVSSIPSASLTQIQQGNANNNSSNARVVRNLHSALHRKQRYDDLENRQRTVDEIRMRTLRYYTQRSGNNNTSSTISSNNSGVVVEDPFSPSSMMSTQNNNDNNMMSMCMHRAKLFGRNEDVES